MDNPDTGLEIHLFPCLSDNYGFLIHDHEHGLTATIDTPDPTAIEKALATKGWTLTHILNTHHHWDHAGGNLELKNRTGCIIVGPRAEAARIPGIDIQVGDGDTFAFGQHTARIHATPGHTIGHIVYHFEDDHVAFVGDTLFALGCGRLFEGTAEQMWCSLQKLMQWPDATRVYCAHEYTQNNARFALTIEPGNKELIARAAEIDRQRAKDHPTIPSTVALEKRTNPFLRPMSREIRDRLNMINATDTEVFAQIRALKDRF
jgi:hydroxyacylglutathione hydrolase